MIVTNADKNGNTLAWQRYKRGFKTSFLARFWTFFLSSIL